MYLYHWYAIVFLTRVTLSRRSSVLYKCVQYVRTCVPCYHNVMSQLADRKRAHMRTENHVCFGRGYTAASCTNWYTSCTIPVMLFHNFQLSVQYHCNTTRSIPSFFASFFARCSFETTVTTTHTAGSTHNNMETTLGNQHDTTRVSRHSVPTVLAST